MGTDIRSISRVRLWKRSVTAGTNIIESGDVILTKDGYTDDDVFPNQTGLATYTVECVPTVSGIMSIIFKNEDGEIVGGNAYTCTAGELAVFEFWIPAANAGVPGWTFNLQYSVDAVMNILCIAEHGGLY